MAISKAEFLEAMGKIKTQQDTANAAKFVDGVVKQATAESGYAATYQLTINGTPAGEKINIPKDFLVKSATLETVATAGQPYAGAGVGDKYIDFVVNAKDSSETAEHIYLPVNDLVDVYTGGNGVEVTAGGAINAVIDSTNANGLSVGANGIGLGLATTTTAGAMSASDKAALDTLAASSDEQISDADIAALFA